jgi:hypothetical protein
MALPPQLTRLVLVTVAIIAGYLLMRAALMPPTFGEHGWYRAAALAELGAQELRHAGRDACAECHVDEADLLAGNEHRHLSCATCHGAGQDHANDPDQSIGRATPQDCRRCHETDPSRPAWFPQVGSANHYPE